MATSDRDAGPLLRYLESRANLAGCGGGLLGLVLTFTGVAGAYWPLVVAGLYGAGALLGAAGGPGPAGAGPSGELARFRAEFGRLREYPAEAELSAASAGRLAELLGRYEDLLAPGWAARALAADPEARRELARGIRQEVPECLAAYDRDQGRDRDRFGGGDPDRSRAGVDGPDAEGPGFEGPGFESPERVLERRLTELYDAAERLTAGLRAGEVRRRGTHAARREEPEGS
ncbi:hypothetical protein [Streptomyces sp. NPDC097619]|uniref:hypothetical protein n=1 Tax=Streptomyces sp. NPDC097619 TaxID=3157228 RepID=UPI00331B4A4C